MASEDLLKKAVAAFKALSPEQQAEMLEEQRQSWVRGNVGLSRDEAAEWHEAEAARKRSVAIKSKRLEAQIATHEASAAHFRSFATRPAPAAPDEGMETVMPLEWRKYRNGDAEAVTPFGEIYTAYVNGYWRITRNGKAGKFVKATGGDDVDAAKAGAQADFDANVLSLVRSQAEELLAAERADKEKWKVRGDQHWDTLRSIREMAREGDCERIILWVNDAGSGYTEPLEATVKTLSDKAVALEADNAALTARVKELEADLMCAKASRDSWKRTHEESFHRLEAKLAAGKVSFQLEWIAGARPPVHPNPMTGRATFDSFDEAVAFMKRQASDAQFVSLTERTIIQTDQDRSTEARAALEVKPS